MDGVAIKTSLSLDSLKHKGALLEKIIQTENPRVAKKCGVNQIGSTSCLIQDRGIISKIL